LLEGRPDPQELVAAERLLRKEDEYRSIPSLQLMDRWHHEDQGLARRSPSRDYEIVTSRYGRQANGLVPPHTVPASRGKFKPVSNAINSKGSGHVGTLFGARRQIDALDDTRPCGFDKLLRQRVAHASSPRP
jgi:hypothetical protein